MYCDVSNCKKKKKKILKIIKKYLKFKIYNQEVIFFQLIISILKGILLNLDKNDM